MKGKTKDGIRECLDQKGNITGYQAIVRETDHLGKKIKITKKWPKRALAKTWREKTIRKIKEGEFDGENKLTKLRVQDMMNYWSEGPPKKHADGGKRMRPIKTHVNRILGEDTLASLGAKRIIMYAEHRFEIDNAAPATIRKELTFMSKAFILYRYFEEFKKENPVQIAIEILGETRYLPPSNHRKVRPTRKQFNALIAYPHKNHTLINKLIEFAALEGMRCGEIVKMQRSHLSGNRLVISITKTGSPRTIALFPRSVEILKSLPAQIDGSFWGYSESGSISTAYARMTKALGIKGLTFHDLRHEACSRMGDMKMGVYDIAVKSGHKNLKMLEAYLQLSSLEDAREYAINKAGLNNRELLIKFGVAA